MLSPSPALTRQGQHTNETTIFRSSSSSSSSQSTARDQPAPPAAAFPSFAGDLRDFVPAPANVAFVPQYADETNRQDEDVFQQFAVYVLSMGNNTAPAAVLFDDSWVVAFFTSKIDAANVEIMTGRETTLSCSSLDDRFLPALRRKRLSLKGDLAFHEHGWFHVKTEVMKRATLARLPLFAKGKCSSRSLSSCPPQTTTNSPFLSVFLSKPHKTAVFRGFRGFSRFYPFPSPPPQCSSL